MTRNDGKNDEQKNDDEKTAHFQDNDEDEKLQDLQDHVQKVAINREKFRHRKDEDDVRNDEQQNGDDKTARFEDDDDDEKLQEVQKGTINRKIMGRKLPRSQDIEDFDRPMKKNKKKTHAPEDEDDDANKGRRHGCHHHRNHRKGSWKRSFPCSPDDAANVKAREDIYEKFEKLSKNYQKKYDNKVKEREEGKGEWAKLNNYHPKVDNDDEMEQSLHVGKDKDRMKNYDTYDDGREYGKKYSPNNDKHENDEEYHNNDHDDNGDGEDDRSYAKDKHHHSKESPDPYHLRPYYDDDNRRKHYEKPPFEDEESEKNRDNKRDGENARDDDDDEDDKKYLKDKHGKWYDSDNAPRLYHSPHKTREDLMKTYPEMQSAKNGKSPFPIGFSFDRGLRNKFKDKSEDYPQRKNQKNDGDDVKDDNSAEPDTRNDSGKDDGNKDDAEMMLMA